MYLTSNSAAFVGNSLPDANNSRTNFIPQIFVRISPANNLCLYGEGSGTVRKPTLTLATQPAPQARHPSAQPNGLGIRTPQINLRPEGAAYVLLLSFCPPIFLPRSRNRIAHARPAKHNPSTHSNSDSISREELKATSWRYSPMSAHAFGIRLSASNTTRAPSRAPRHSMNETEFLEWIVQ